MYRVQVSFCAIALCLLIQSSALPGQGPGAPVVNFDNLNTGLGPVTVTTAYSGLGVVFQNAAVVDASGDPIWSSGPGSMTYSSPNVLALNPFAPFSLTTTLTFVVPGSTIQGVTDRVQWTMYDSEIGTNMAMVTARDASGTVIASQTVQTPMSQVVTITVATPGIATLSISTDADGAGIDNLSFNTPVAAATSATSGTGCGTGSMTPTLAASLPILGQSLSLSVANATVSAPGSLFIGIVSPTPLMLPPGCLVYLDIATLQPFQSIMTDMTGGWSASIPLPTSAMLAGASASFQAVIFPGSSPIGLELTNAVTLVLGY